MERLTPQFSFQDGELTINTPSRSYRIHGWPEPCARERLGDGDWKNCRPECGLVKPRLEVTISAADVITPGEDDCGPELVRPHDAPDEKRMAFEAFRSQLPEGVAYHIERFQSHQWNMLDLLSKEDAAQDLAESNAVLCWCLANNDQFRRPYGLASPAVYAQHHVLKKQREILEWLGFQAAESVVKVMRKIIPEAITTLDARMLRQAVLEPVAARFLAHLRAINSGVLGLACNLKLLPFVTPQLLAEVAQADAEKTRQPTADLLIDAIYLMVLSQFRLPVPQFPSMDSVREFHNRVMAESRRKSAAREKRSLAKAKQKRVRKPQGLPPPPIPGTQDIIPLTTKEDLRAEGKKVLNPERATVAITVGSDGFWKRAELECTGNQPVSWLTEAKVDEWLATHSLSV